MVISSTYEYLGGDLTHYFNIMQGSGKRGPVRGLLFLSVTTLLGIMNENVGQRYHKTIAETQTELLSV
jgi:hypothetical protein